MLLGYDSTHRTRQGHYQPDGPNFHPPDIHAGLASPPSSLPSSSASSSAVSEGLSAVRGVVLRFPGNIQLRTVLGAHLTFLGWVLGPGGACFFLATVPNLQRSVSNVGSLLQVPGPGS